MAQTFASVMRRRAPAEMRAFCSLIVVGAALISSSAIAQDVTATDRSGLHAAMTRALREEKLVGAVWATLSPDGVVTGAAGLRDSRRAEALTAANKVQIGSVTKPLLATGVLRLVTEGLVSLDTPVASLLPKLALNNPWEATHPLLLRHLLDHTSGLDDARLWQVFTLEARPDMPLSASLGRDPSLLRVRSRPGMRVSYSNLGYTLVGMVIEAVVGARYEAYLDAHLLRPLGMQSSSFQFISQTGAQADTQLAMGHFENGAPQAAVASYLRPPGQFTTTAADMARFALFLMSNGEVDGVRFVDEKLLRAMGRPAQTEAVTAGLDAGYGLGLARRDRHGVLGRCHVGTTLGYRANLCLFPEQQKAFFVSMNADVETADYERFDALLVRALTVRAAEPAMPAAPPVGVADWEGIYALSPNPTESFAYLDHVLNFATLRWDGARLQLKPFQSAVRSLKPVGGMRFRSHDRTAASHILLTSSDGRRVISDGNMTFEQVSGWRMALLWASLAAGLSGLVYLVLTGMFRMVRRRLRMSQPIFVPFLAAVALALPVPFFLSQSFMQLGDLTIASALLALVTGALPLAMVFGLWRRVVQRGAERRGMLEAMAAVSVLQWAVVLASWGLLPLRLWA